MADRDGDPNKQPPECTAKQGSSATACPHIKETSSPTDMDGETYDCAICGEHFRLYYEDMQ